MCENEKMQLLISGHLDGCNTPEEERALQEHLARCPDCRQALKEYERIDALLRSIPPAEVPEGLTERIMQAVEAEPRRSAPAKKRKLPFGFATAAAAVAAVLLLAVSSGWLPGMGNGSAKLFASKSADAEMPAAAAEPACAEEPEAEEPAAIAPEAAYSAATETPAGLPANVDAQALADAELCPVGVLYADPAGIPELEGRSSLPLSGGLRYTLRQSELNAIAAGYDLTVYTPESYINDDNGRALLIVVTQ